MNRFLISLLSGDEENIDSTITCGIAALIMFFGLSGYAVAKDPTIWSTPAAWMGWAGAAAVIIGIVSAARTARSRWSSGAQSATLSTSPEGVTQQVESKP